MVAIHTVRSFHMWDGYGMLPSVYGPWSKNKTHDCGRTSCIMPIKAVLELIKNSKVGSKVVFRCEDVHCWHPWLLDVYAPPVPESGSAVAGL